MDPHLAVKTKSSIYLQALKCNSKNHESILLVVLCMLPFHTQHSYCKEKGWKVEFLCMFHVYPRGSFNDATAFYTGISSAVTEHFAVAPSF